MTGNESRRLSSRLQDALFRNIHGRFLIYNTCWEDPRIDRQLLEIDADSDIVVITSAGCNALDYLLDGPRSISAVDVNPRQNALLELKLAMIRRGRYDDFFAMFGRGGTPEYLQIYRDARPLLSEQAAAFWDRNIRYFHNRGARRTFYYHGTSGVVAWVVVRLLLRSRRLRPLLFDLLDADDLAEQRRIYDEIEPLLWNRVVEWLLGRQATMAMLGVPRSQARMIRDTVPGGTAAFVKQRLRHVATQVLMRDNYFWRVYLTGVYSPDCCPNYLDRQHFERLRERVHRVSVHTATVTDFLRMHPGRYSHFVLLDHQDWLVRHDPDALAREWQAILANSVPGSRVVMRSAGLTADFLPRFAGNAIRLHPERTEPLHAGDRVGTYGSLHLAEVL